MPTKQSNYPMGVRFHRNTGKYRAQHRDKYLGLFATVAEAAAVVEAARAADPIVYQPQPAYLVDEDIAAEISAFRWTTGTGGYMQRGRNGMKLVVMHRLAWKLYGGSEPQSGHEIDHINRDPSDNRRCNLRLVTRRGNTLNRRSDKCVRRHKSGSWEVRVAPNASDGFNRCYQDEETARLVARHVREKLIEREVIEYLKEKNDGSV